MVRVIAGYASFEDARRAVRRLEPQQSIQDIVILDQFEKVRGKLLRTEERQGSRLVSRFVVIMRGEANELGRARALLSSPDGTS